MENNNKEILYAWQYSDTKVRWKLWYTIAFSIVLWLVIWWLFTKQYWFSFVLILACWIYLFISNNSSEVINVELTENWLQVENSFYDFWRIDSYSIVYDWELAVLLRLKLNKKWSQDLELRVDNDIARILKTVLPNFLAENSDNELSASDKLINFLKL